MVGLLGYAAAGALAGAGTGMVEDARAKRDAVKEELRRQHASAEAEKDRSFRSGEAEKDRTQRGDLAAADRDMRLGLAQEDRAFRAEQSEQDRAFRSGEAEKDRAFRSDMAVEMKQGADGVWYAASKTSGEVKPLTINGKPFVGKPEGKTGEQPANVKAAQWLAEMRAKAEGREVTADDLVKSFERIQEGVNKPLERARLVTTVYKSMKDDLTDRRTDDEKRAAAKSFVDDLVKKESEGGEAAGSEPAAATGTGAQSQTYPDAPRDPAQRTVGTVYRSPSGIAAEWTGNGWRRID